MPTKFYWHDVATSNAGTLPGTGISVSVTTPTQIGSGVNRSMDAAIGGAQTSRLITTLAQTGTQSAMIARFLSAPIAAQTIASQTITVRLGASEANANSDFLPLAVIAVWRPGTGALVGRIADLVSSGSTEPGTGETAISFQILATNGIVVLDGDVLVFEIWRAANTQVMATAYTNTVFYDGTTEGSTTSNAAHVEFTNNVALYTPTVDPVRRVAFPGTPRGNAVQRSSRW